MPEETKKTKDASLEQYRAQAWLMGLVMALALMFVALEYTSGSNDDADDAQLDDLAQEFEEIPALDMRDMTPAAEPQAAASQQTEVKAVKTPTPIAELNEGKLNADANLTGTAVSDSGLADGNAEPTDETQALSPLPVNDPDNPLNFRVVETLPDFPGGMVEFMKWLRNNLRYPVSARRRKVEGKVVVSFIVGKDGSVSDLKVVTPADPALNAEALRVMRMLPKWKPGTEMGRPARTMMCIPIVFKL